MRVVIKYPDKCPLLVDLEQESDALMAVVGGYIATLPVKDNIIAIVNSEAMRDIPNIGLNGWILFGTVVFAHRQEGQDITSLTNEEAEYLLETYY